MTKRVTGHAGRSFGKLDYRHFVSKCIACGTYTLSAELYPLDYTARTVRTRLKEKPLHEINTRFKCFRCMGP